MSKCRQSDKSDPLSWELVVKCEGESVPVRCEWGEGGLEVWVEGREEAVTITTDWNLGEPMMLADIDGKEVAVQVRSTPCSNKEHHSRNLVVADLNPIQCISSALFSSVVFIGCFVLCCQSFI